MGKEKLKLENCTLDELFPKGLSKNWKYALSVGTTKYYKNGILNYYIENDILVINSGTISNKKFNKELLRDIKKLIISHDKVIVSSSNQNIAQYKKYGFIFNKNYYSKGL